MNQLLQPTTLMDWKGSSRRPCFDEMNRDDTDSNGRPSIDLRLLGEEGEQYYDGLSRVVEIRPIGPSPVLRSCLVSI